MVETSVLRAPELRKKWIEYLQRNHETLTCDDVRLLLFQEGLQALGESKKAQIRNIHGAAMSEPRVEKRAAGQFCLKTE